MLFVDEDSSLRSVISHKDDLNGTLQNYSESFLILTRCRIYNCRICLHAVYYFSTH